MYHINMRLREITGKNVAFGGVTVVLLGDPGQIPPVGGNSVWNSFFGTSKKNENEIKGYQCYCQFQVCMKLFYFKRNINLSPMAVPTIKWRPPPPGSVYEV